MSRRKKKTSHGFYDQKLEVLLPGDWMKHLRSQSKASRKRVSEIVRDILAEYLQKCGYIVREGVTP